MPIYEYVCEEDGQVLELMRPMDRADDAVEDPSGKGRVFKRRFSTFSAGPGASRDGGGGGDGGERFEGGCLGGNPNGRCSTG